MSNKGKDMTPSRKTKIIFKQQPEKLKTPSNINLYKYPISKILTTDLNKIDLKNLKTIFVCVFHINDSFNSATSMYHPFIEYYLWKYPKSNDKYSDLFVFPFQKYDKKKTVTKTANDILKKLHKSDNTTQHGFIQENDSVYLFYELN